MLAFDYGVIPAYIFLGLGLIFLLGVVLDVCNPTLSDTDVDWDDD